MGAILHQVAKMKAFIVISFALASYVAADGGIIPKSKENGNERFIGGLIHHVINNVFGTDGESSGSMDIPSSWGIPSSWDTGSEESFDPWNIGTSGTSGTIGGGSS